jgi:hypothetical protein
VGYDLNAAEAAVRSTSSTSANKTMDARLIYNSACQEMAVLLQSNNQLWNRTESINSSDQAYRLHFDAGSRQKGTWDPSYFDFFRTPKQVHQKIPTEQRRAGGWGGVLAGIHKPADPRKQFFPLVGVSVPVTATVDFASPRSDAKKVCDVTFALRDPTRLERVHVGAQRPLAADFVAPIAYYPNPGLLGLQAMLRPAKYRERSGLTKTSGGPVESAVDAGFWHEVKAMTTGNVAQQTASLKSSCLYLTTELVSKNVIRAQSYL